MRYANPFIKIFTIFLSIIFFFEQPLFSSLPLDSVTPYKKHSSCLATQSGFKPLFDDKESPANTIAATKNQKNSFFETTEFLFLWQILARAMKNNMDEEKVKQLLNELIIKRTENNPSLSLLNFHELTIEEAPYITENKKEYLFVIPLNNSPMELVFSINPLFAPKQAKKIQYENENFLYIWERKSTVSAITNQGTIRTLSTSAIGNGTPLKDLIKGTLPPRADISRETNTLFIQELKRAISQILTLEKNQPLQYPNNEFIIQNKRVIQHLTEIFNSPAPGNYFYFFHAIVNGPEDYLLGFRQGKILGLSVELLEKFIINSSRFFLEQYIYHECADEQYTISADGYIYRTSHQLFYMGVQTVFWGREASRLFKMILRDFINTKQPNIPPIKSIIKKTLEKLNAALLDISPDPDTLKIIELKSKSIITASAVYKDLLVTSGTDKKLTLWRADSEKGFIPTTSFDVNFTINNLAINKNIIAATGKNHEIMIWDISDNLAPIQYSSLTHKDNITSIALSQNYLISTDETGIIKIWDIKNRYLLSTTRCHKGRIYSSTLKGNYLFTSGEDSLIKIWDISFPYSLKLINIFVNNQKQNTANVVVKLDIEQNTLATLDIAGTVTLWNIQNPIEPQFIKVLPIKAVNAIRVCLTKNLLIYGTSAGIIELWDIADPANPKFIQNHTAHDDAITCLGVSNDFLISSSFDQTIKIISLEPFLSKEFSNNNFSLLWSIQHAARSYENKNNTFIHSLQLANEYIIHGLGHNNICIINSRDFKNLKFLKKNPLSSRKKTFPLISASDQFLAIEDSQFNQILLFNNLEPSIGPTLPSQSISAMQLSRGLLISGHRNGEIQIFETPSLKRLSVLTKRSHGHTTEITKIIINKNILITADILDTINVWDITNPSSPLFLKTLIPNNNGIISPLEHLVANDNFIVCIDAIKRLTIWDIKNLAAAPADLFINKREKITCTALEENLLFLGYSQGLLLVYNIKNHSIFLSRINDTEISSLAVNNNILAIGDISGTLKIFKIPESVLNNNDDADISAIGNGPSLKKMLQGSLPKRLTLEPREKKILLKKFYEALQIAIDITKNNSTNSENAAVLAKLNSLLDIKQANNFLYFFHAVIKDPENYLLGFRYKEKIGLSVELINYLFDISPVLLAQYIYHECLPEKYTLFTSVEINRSSHKINYENQSAIFGAIEQEHLGKTLRNFIMQNLDSFAGLKRRISVIKKNASFNIKLLFKENQKQNNRSIILYSDDILKNAVLLDFPATLNLLKKQNALGEGNILLFTKDKKLEDQTKLLADYIQYTLGGQIKILIVKQWDTASNFMNISNPAIEAKKLIKLSKKEGARDVIAIIRGNGINWIETFKDYKMNVPIVIMNDNTRGAFSFSDALNKALERRLGIDYITNTGFAKWIICLEPVEKLTEKMYEEYLFYREKLLNMA
ncbi:hypothetical protein OMAG_001770 [Candidatus Omnitrophus magneticus]|uniref:Uncharacterized protein n=1 Tax=Candidatus Omnitrophus magneticus TaxID=1609969 RepID=A0A0F0CM44_9BACT|nr:hypothetical protein OMAG_001770 [Candidatus Omnitrophus magneticus]